jgi:signal transduction histidine kinase
VLYDFLIANRTELIDRCKAKALLRPGPFDTKSEPLHGIPRFIDQLIETLRIEAVADTGGSERLSGPSGASRPMRSDLGEAAGLHGRELFSHGFTIDQVVHDYGDLCQAVTELASEHAEPIAVAEFHTLNRCLDNAIADAVKEYAYGRKLMVDDETFAMNERHGSFVHELRNHLGSAKLAFALVRNGQVAPSGATSDVLERALAALSDLVERAISETRTGIAGPVRNKLVSLADFIGDTYRAASLEALAQGRLLVASEVDPTLAIDVDPVLLSSALINLINNAIKFTFHGTTVRLDAYATAERILISVTDQCGGIDVHTQATMFQPFVQGSANRTGLGLGLPISRKYVEACQGTLTCRNVPGEGCVFTIDLPRHRLPVATAPALASRRGRKS